MDRLELKDQLDQLDLSVFEESGVFREMMD
jgi:hypothetical protein